jgi:2'-deoxynucleoside 5'-phosphate N-hydrolase
MVIYFAGSITGGRGDVAHYREVVAALEADGHRVLAGAVAAEHIGPSGEPLTPCDIFERDVGWLSEADVLVAEVSTPSLGVGYEIATMRYKVRRPVIALYRLAFTARCSAMVSGDRGIELIEYDALADLLPRLRQALPKYAAAVEG